MLDMFGGMYFAFIVCSTHYYIRFKDMTMTYVYLLVRLPLLHTFGCVVKK